jgi:hypothetical protein
MAVPQKTKERQAVEMVGTEKERREERQAASEFSAGLGNGLRLHSQEWLCHKRLENGCAVNSFAAKVSVTE